MKPLWKNLWYAVHCIPNLWDKRHTDLEDNQRGPVSVQKPRANPLGWRTEHKLLLPSVKLSSSKFASGITLVLSLLFRVHVLGLFCSWLCFLSSLGPKYIYCIHMEAWVSLGISDWLAFYLVGASFCVSVLSQVFWLFFMSYKRGNATA